MIATVKRAPRRRGGQSPLSRRLQAVLPMSSSCFIHADHIMAARSESLLAEIFNPIPTSFTPPTAELRWKAGVDGPLQLSCVIKSETLKEVIARGQRNAAAACINYLRVCGIPKTVVSFFLIWLSYRADLAWC